MSDELRSEFSAASDAGDVDRAIQAARRLLAADSGIRQWSFVRGKLRDQLAEAEGLESVRVALLSSFSIEFIHDALDAAGFLERLNLSIYQAGFQQFRQELLLPTSGLYAFEPRVVFLSVEGNQLLPEIYEDFAGLSAEAVDACIERALEELQGLIEALRSRSEATLVLHDFAAPLHAELGIFDGQAQTGQRQAIERANHGLLKLARAQRGVHVLGYHQLISRHGTDSWFDQRMRHFAKAPIARHMLPELAKEYVKYLRAVTGRTRKCLVLDLDNTLWGGVIGEDGLEGIALGPDYPGSAYVEFQQSIRRLFGRGVILALASKNNLTDVQEVFERHPHMQLGLDDFAVKEVHWQPKTVSLQNIAQRLNIGLSHLVFVDDNPAECQLVRSELPMVTVIELPRRPEQYIDALLRDGYFDVLALSAEDRARGKLYQQRAAAEDLRKSSTSLEGYYAALAMRVEVEPVTDGNLPRVAQLTQKTNQFNATTRRYTEAEVAARAGSPDWLVSAVRVSDKFGDNGIVGVMMAELRANVLLIDNFLMSCRVIGRTVETAMLAVLCRFAKERGATRLEGVIVPTKKNVPVRDLFERHGFQKLRDDADGGVSWSADLSTRSIEVPAWLDLRFADASTGTQHDRGARGGADAGGGANAGSGAAGAAAGPGAASAANEGAE